MLRGQLDDAHGPGLGKFAIPSCLTVRVPAGRANRTQGGLLRRNPFPPAEPSLLTAPGVGGQRQLHRHRAAWTPAPRKSCGRFHSTNEWVQLRQVLRGRVWARKVALNKFHRRGTAEDLAAHDTPPKSTRPQSTTIAARRTIAGHIGDGLEAGARALSLETVYRTDPDTTPCDHTGSGTRVGKDIAAGQRNKAYDQITVHRVAPRPNAAQDHRGTIMRRDTPEGPVCVRFCTLNSKRQGTRFPSSGLHASFDGGFT